MNRNAYRAARKRWRAQLAAELDSVTEPLPELHRLAALDACVNRPRMLSEGPYATFMRSWVRANPETPDQRRARRTANYLRHARCSYDLVVAAMRDVPGVPDTLAADVWSDAMDLMVERWPELESARARGHAAKVAYAEHRRCLAS